MTKTLEALKTEIVDAFTARKLKETTRDASNNNIQKNLDKYLKEVSHDNVVAILLASNFDAAFINSNVYAVEKAIAAARYVAKCDRLDVYTDAIFKSMIACESASIEITRDVIASFCSNDIKTKYDAKIKATRVQTTKSNSTVATQHNSSVNAMRALNMLNASRNAANEETFTLDRSSHVVQQIAALKEIKLVADVATSEAQ